MLLLAVWVCGAEENGVGCAHAQNLHKNQRQTHSRCGEHADASQHQPWMRTRKQNPNSSEPGGIHKHLQRRDAVAVEIAPAHKALSGGHGPLKHEAPEIRAWRGLRRNLCQDLRHVRSVFGKLRELRLAMQDHLQAVHVDARPGSVHSPYTVLDRCGGHIRHLPDDVHQVHIPHGNHQIQQKQQNVANLSYDSSAATSRYLVFLLQLNLFEEQLLPLLPGHLCFHLLVFLPHIGPKKAEQRQERHDRHRGIMLKPAGPRDFLDRLCRK
mmetsp:Transcript_14138/g.33715  ORF Transcript_14138/g.33715 Transcript_14138/m.33715 type:complete len:268 (-) Transcript_14138:766-1569(-)